MVLDNSAYFSRLTIEMSFTGTLPSLKRGLMHNTLTCRKNLNIMTCRKEKLLDVAPVESCTRLDITTKPLWLKTS